MEKAKYKIILPEDVEFFLEEEVVQKIPFFKKYFGEHSSKEIKINNIKGQVFSHIVTHIRSQNIDPTDSDFTNRMLKNISIDDYFDVVIAAEFLGVKSLVESAKERFVGIISNGDPIKIRKNFKLKYDIDDENEVNDVHYDWKEL